MRVYKIKSVLYFLKKGKLKFILNGIRKRIYSEIICLGVKRDLNNNFQSPDSKIKIKTRLFKKSDGIYFAHDNHNYGLIEEDIKNCYVATTINDIPCFRIWIMESSQNSKIQSFFPGNFPSLNKNELLVEAAFTLPEYRGNRILSTAINKIIENNNNRARYLLAFIDIKNVNSLKGYKHSGFDPYLLRVEKWFFFSKRVYFSDIPKEIQEKYLSDTSGI